MRMQPGFNKKTKAERVEAFKHDWKVIEDAYHELHKTHRVFDSSIMSQHRQTILRFFDLTEEDVK